jgi:hypothetical protein
LLAQNAAVPGQFTVNVHHHHDHHREEANRSFEHHHGRPPRMSGEDLLFLLCSIKPSSPTPVKSELSRVLRRGSTPKAATPKSASIHESRARIADAWASR